MKKTVQDQRVDARRDQILEAAAKVFAEKGFHAATIKDIARAAEIADGTIYIYFKNKTALLLGIFERMKDLALQEGVPEALEAKDFPSFLHAYIVYPLMALRKDNFALFRIIISEIMVNAELRAQYNAQILQPTLEIDEQYFYEQAAKYGVRLKDAQLAVRTIAIVVMGMLMTEILSNEPLDGGWEEIPSYLAELIIHSSEEL